MIHWAVRRAPHGFLYYTHNVYYVKSKIFYVLEGKLFIALLMPQSSTV